MTNKYNNYGYDEQNPGMVISKVDGVEPEAIFGVFSLQDETRKFRKEVIQHITNKHDETRKIVNEHTTKEVDDAEQKILKEIGEHHDYIINTIEPKLDSTKVTVEENKKKIAENKSLLNEIWDKIRPWNWNN